MMARVSRKYLLAAWWGVNLVCWSAEHLSANPPQERLPHDTVPRDRLVSDAELLALVDFSATPTLAKLHTAFHHEDSPTQLRRFARYLRQRTAPKYFFDSNKVRHRAAEFAKRYPEPANTTKRGADDFIATYGADVDWWRPGQDRLGRAHTPNTIRFLARQWQAENIALAYNLTKERRYLDFLMAHVRDFVQDYEAGKAEAGDNDVFERFYAGHRTRNWLGAHYLLLGAPDYRWEDQLLMLKVFLLHGGRLVDQCRRFNWGNHQLHGLAGLYEMSLMFPEFPVMREWNRQAFKLLFEHLEKEIATDGFQFERASHYHKLDIINYFRVYRLAQINGVDLPAFYAERFRKMFEAIVALAMPAKSLPVLQDAQDNYPAPSNSVDREKRAETNDMAELPDTKEGLFMSLGAAVFNDPVYKFFGSDGLPAALYWFLEAEAPQKYAALAPHAPALGSVALPETKYYVMRTGWKPDDLYLLIDGGLAKHKPDHTHGGILGVIGYGFGEQFLPNYPVRYSDPAYKTLKNSLVKNVALADNILQGSNWRDNKARTGFGIWQKLPTPAVQDWVSGESFDYFSGSHNGFDSVGVQYTRSILFCKPRYWMVLDEFKGEKAHSFQQIWQGRYEVDREHNLATYAGQTARLQILQADPTPMNIAARRHFFTESVQFEKGNVSSYTFVTLLNPSARTAAAAPRLIRNVRPNFTEVEIAAGDRRDNLYLADGSEFNSDKVKSDAKLVALCAQNDGSTALLMHRGTRVGVVDFLVEAETPATVELTRHASGDWIVQLLQGESQSLTITLKDGTKRVVHMNVAQSRLVKF